MGIAFNALNEHHHFWFTKCEIEGTFPDDCICRH